MYVWWEFDDQSRTRTRLQFVDTASGQATPVIDAQHIGAAVAWHPNGRRLASSGLRDQRVRIWDARTGAMLAESPYGIPGGVSAAYLGGDELLLAQFGGVVRRIDAETFEPRADRFVIVKSIELLTYASPDGRTAAILARGPITQRREFFRNSSADPANLFLPDDRLVLVDAVDGRQLYDFTLGFDAEWAAFSPDGQRVAVTGRGGQIALVDVAAGALVRPPVVGHDGNVTSVDYAPDGATVVSGGVDGRVTLWDGETGVVRESVQIAPAHEHGIAVAFKRDGDTVAVATWDGDIHTLDVRPAQWAAAACRIAGRNLTRAEWRDAFGDRPWQATCPGR